MPNRIIREGILSSEKIDLLNWAEEVFYRRLQSIVDDYGRYEANAKLLRSKCYPLKTDDVKQSHIVSWLAACAKAGLLVCYRVDGKDYIEILNFGQQIRAKSKFPEPPIASDSNCLQPIGNEHLGVSVFGVVSEGEGVAPQAAAPTRQVRKPGKSQMPEDFGVSERVRAWAAAKGYTHLQEHLEAFKRKVAAKGYTYVKWDDAFMEAIREDWAKLRGRNPNGSAPAPEIPMDPDSRAAVEADGVRLGIGKWNEEAELWTSYKARVRGTSNERTLA